MTESTQAAERLAELPRSERFEVLDELVTAQFKAGLLMPAEDEFPRTESFFEIGLTSLRLAEIKQRLETLLGCAIDTTQLFNQPTLERLLEYLTREVFPELFAGERV